MFEKILIPTDFSDYARYIVECIHEIPGARRVILLHVVNSGAESNGGWFFSNSNSKDEFLKEIQKEMNEEKIFMNSLGMDVSLLIEENKSGRISDSILSVADKEDVSLIVQGARGRGLIEGFFLGSVSESVLRKADRHVMIIPYKKKTNTMECSLEKSCINLLSNILCPVDFSKPSHDLVLKIKKYNKYFSRVTLLHVIKSAETIEEIDSLMEEGDKHQGFMKKVLEEAGLHVDCKISLGSPVEMITKYTCEKGNSLIMMGRFGKNDYITNVALGSVTAEVAKQSKIPVFVMYPGYKLDVSIRELVTEEFSLCEELWLNYHGQKVDPVNDRIFGVFVEGTLVGVGRCKRHSDGLEVDAIFVPEIFRGQGYANLVVKALVGACGGETLYMHSVTELINFYKKFGFEEINEKELPLTIKDRFTFALGELEGINVTPMRRYPPELPRGK